MNGFVEIVLGASIVIPIAVGYLGLDWVKENAGFAMAFQTMPFLFGKWGLVIGEVISPLPIRISILLPTHCQPIPW